MKLKIYSLKDKKIGFQNLLLFRTEGEAIRAFDQGVNHADHALKRYPQDYELCEIGKFDDETGKIEALETAKTVAEATDYKRETNNA
jgi:hypothetical protein